MQARIKYVRFINMFILKRYYKQYSNIHAYG